MIKMPRTIKYRLKFPEIEFEAIHAQQAKLDALKYFQKNLLEIEWEEIPE